MYILHVYLVPPTHRQKASYLHTTNQNRYGYWTRYQVATLTVDKLLHFLLR